MIDRYTKIVLTVIAAALVTLAAQQAMRSASAQMGSCTFAAPCSVIIGTYEESRPLGDQYRYCGHAARPCFVQSR